MHNVNLEEKLAAFDERWSPCMVTSYSGNDTMVVKLEGGFVWHSHLETDDFFLVLKSDLDIETRDRTVPLGPEEPFVVPRGVEHRPVASGEVHLPLIEPAGTADPAAATEKTRA